MQCRENIQDISISYVALHSTFVDKTVSSWYRGLAMQTTLQREGVRRRLGDLIRQQHGEVSPSVLVSLSTKARVHYTSLARYLLYPQQKRTRALRRQTLEAVAIALDVNPEWVRDGQGPKQLALWP